MDSKADPKGKHEARVVSLGSELEWWLDEFGYLDSYQKFKLWASESANCSGAAVQNSLKCLGLWRSGERGKKGGTQLHRMQDDIVEFAKRRGGEE